MHTDGALNERLRFGVAPATTDDDSPDLRRVAGIVNAAREVYGEFQAALAAIDADPDLSDTGKAKRRSQLAAAPAKVLDKQEQMIATAAKRLDADMAKIKATLNGAGRGDQLEAMLAAEYRAVLRAMAESERQNEIWGAINARDLAKLRAIAGAMPQAIGLSAVNGGVAPDGARRRGLHAMAQDALIEAEHGDDALQRLERHAAVIGAARQAVQAGRALIKERTNG